MESRPDFENTWDDLANEVADDQGLADDETLPTPADVATALGEVGMARAREKYRLRFSALYDLVKKEYPEDRFGLFPQSDPPDPPTRWHSLDMESALWVEGLPVSGMLINADGEIDRRLTVGLQMLNLIVLLVGPEDTLRSLGPKDDQPVGAEDSLIAGFEAVHMIWQSADPAKRAGLEHPLKPLIAGWLNRPEVIQPDLDKGGRPQTRAIMPDGLFPGQPYSIPAQLRSDNGGEQLPILGKMERDGEQLPLLADILDDADLPIAPLLLAKAAGFHGLKPGRGARLDKRILIFSLLEMPLNQRRPGGRYELRRPLRFWRDLLWPTRDGKSSYRPVKHKQALRDALTAINLAEIIMPDGSSWIPVVRRGIPDLDSLDSEVIIQIELPSGSDRGPQVDKGVLAVAGVVSDPAFDLELGLAYLWDEAKRRNGGYRVYATRPEVIRNKQGHILDAADQVIVERGKPVTRWDHPRAVRTGRMERNPAADRVRVLDREARRRLAYGSGNSKRPDQLSRDRAATDKKLAGIERDGRILIERDAVDLRNGGDGWRILEVWTPDA